MNFLVQLIVAILVGAVVLWLLTAVFFRHRIPLKDAARIPIACVAVRRLITFVAGFFLTGHPAPGRWIGLGLGFVVQAEILHLDLAGRAEKFHKPSAMLLSAVLVLVDQYGSIPLAGWLWPRIAG